MQIDRTQLRKALISAFQSEAELELMLADEMDIRLNTVACGSNYELLVFNLVKKLEAQGNTVSLLEAALRSNPGNPELQKLAHSLNSPAPAPRERHPSGQPLLRSPSSSSPPPLPSPSPNEMQHQDIEALVQILADQATFAPIGSKAYLRDLVLKANLPKDMLREAIGVGTGNPEVDARELVHWAKSKGGVNPGDSRFTVLGSLIQPLVKSVGLDIAGTIVGLIARYNLFRDTRLLQEFPVWCELPLTSTPVGEAVAIGPDFRWRGSTDDQELQGLFRRLVTVWDVAFIQRGVQQAASVCRIEVNHRAIGTGFLVSRDLLLTNYHVLAPNVDDEPNAVIPKIALRFGYLTSEDGHSLNGRVYGLAPNSIIQHSPTYEFDYALLRVENRILVNSSLHPVTLNPNTLPRKHMGINLLQHPAGETMKIALCANGIDGVYESDGLIQYYSETTGGSSGSPCFDDEWQVIALHHAQRSQGLGVICEGILIRDIYPQISKELEL